MKSWVIAKLLWNPDQDTDALISEFIADYYGCAAPYIQQYFDLCKDLVKPDTVMGIYINEWNPLYSDEFIAQAARILDEAASVSMNDEIIRHRVDLVRLQICFLRVMRSPQETANDGTKEWLIDFVIRHNIRMNEVIPTPEFVKKL